MGNWAGTGGVKRVEPEVEMETGYELLEREVEDAKVKLQRGRGGGRVSEVVMYNIVGKSIPIVHRIVRRHTTQVGPSFLPSPILVVIFLPPKKLQITRAKKKKGIFKFLK